MMLDSRFSSSPPGVTVTQVREDIRTVDVVARTSGTNRLDPTKLLNMTLTSSDGRLIPLSQIGNVVVREEDPILKRRDRVPTITLRAISMSRFSHRR